MYAIHKSSTTTQRVTPNVLPCSIKHNGPVNASTRYWSPQPDANDNSTSTAYFRGRKLRSRKIRIPQGFQGVVLQKTEKVLPARRADGASMAERLRRMEEGEDDENEMVIEEEVEVKVLEEKAKFDEMLVWGHEVVPAEDDAFVRGVQEWIGFAEAMHSYEDAVKDR